MEPLNQDSYEGALILGWKVTRIQGEQSQRNIHNDLDDACQLFLGQDIRSCLCVNAVPRGVPWRSLGDPSFVHLRCSNAERCRLEQPLATEQLTDCFGLDIGTALSQHNQRDKGWRQLILGSASTICGVDHNKLLVKPLPALICSWKIGL